MTHDIIELGHISSGDKSLPDCSKPLPEPMLIFHHLDSVTIIFVFHKHLSHQL